MRIGKAKDFSWRGIAEKDREFFEDVLAGHSNRSRPLRGLKRSVIWTAVHAVVGRTCDAACRPPASLNTAAGAASVTLI